MIRYDYERIDRTDAIDRIEGVIELVGDRLRMELNFDRATAVRYFLSWLAGDGADDIRDACERVYAAGQDAGARDTIDDLHFQIEGLEADLRAAKAAAK
jgi:hypothetical protein